MIDKKDIIEKILGRIDKIDNLVNTMVYWVDMNRVLDLTNQHWDLIKLINPELWEELNYYRFEAKDWINSGGFTKDMPLVSVIKDATTNKDVFLYWDRASFIDYLVTLI